MAALPPFRHRECVVRGNPARWPLICRPLAAEKCLASVRFLSTCSQFGVFHHESQPYNGWLEFYRANGDPITFHLCPCMREARSCTVRKKEGGQGEPGRPCQGPWNIRRIYWFLIFDGTFGESGRSLRSGRRAVYSYKGLLATMAAIGDGACLLMSGRLNASGARRTSQDINASRLAEGDACMGRWAP